MKDNKELVILAGRGGGGGGSGTDPNAVHYTADSGHSDSEKAAARSNIGATTNDDAREYIETNGLRDLCPKPTMANEGMALVALDDTTADWRVVRPVAVTVSEAAASITPADNRVYKCGTLTSLTISTPPATGEYTIVFTSGSTATTTTIPSTILGLESFAAEANTLYEINVLDNRAVVGSWAVSSS